MPVKPYFVFSSPLQIMVSDRVCHDSICTARVLCRAVLCCGCICMPDEVSRNFSVIFSMHQDHRWMHRAQTCDCCEGLVDRARGHAMYLHCGIRVLYCAGHSTVQHARSRETQGLPVRTCIRKDARIRIIALGCGSCRHVRMRICLYNHSSCREAQQ